MRAQGPSFGGIFERWSLLSGMVRLLHVTTSPEIIRRFVLLEKGMPCSALRRYETERILRAQPFLAEASVTAYPDGAGVRVEVVTVDEVSSIAGLRMSQRDPYLTALRLGNQNLNGLGIYAMGEWRENYFYRDTYGARLIDHQLLGKPYILSLRGTRRKLGGEWAADVMHPYFSDVQRIAWRASGGESHEFVSFSRPGAVSSTLDLRRRYGDIGGILRIGEPGRLSLFGASLSRESVSPPSLPIIVTDTGVLADTTSALIGRYSSQRTARVNALWGVRSIRFLRVAGFDALTAEQDVRTGFQLGTLFGRSLSVLGSRDDDIQLSADVYAGYGTPWSFAALQVEGEGRQSYDDNRWDEILGSARLAWYVKFQPRHTMITSLEWGGGWRQRSPYQLTLGEPSGGVRGYRATRLPGARRGVARIENRWFLGNVRGNADAGLGFFMDAGRMWAGDAPFGLNTPVYYSLGASLFAAVPPRSQRLWRVDVAFPLVQADGARIDVRLTSEDRTRAFWLEPTDLVRSRERSVPSSIFTWP